MSFSSRDVLLVPVVFSGGGGHKKRPVVIVFDSGDADMLVVPATSQAARSARDVPVVNWQRAGPRLRPFVTGRECQRKTVLAPSSLFPNRPAREPKSAAVMRVHECQRAMDRAAKVAGIAHITHHDLRHWFATRCIESGVDIPTVSRCLGHRDGGALAMKDYGDLRDQHSAAMALKVSFGALEKS